MSGDRTVAAVIAAAPPGSRVLALSDHGHLPRGGHGDAEDAVRRVRACLTPAPRVPTGASIALVDLARVVADDLGLALDRRSLARPLEVATTSSPPDALLPRAPAWRIALAAVVLLIGLGVAVRLGGAAALWPALSLLAWSAWRGLPSLSNRPALEADLLLALVPAIIALATAASPRRLVARCLTPIALAAALAVLTGIPDHLLGGPPPRLPLWTGRLMWTAALATWALLVGALVAATRRVRPADTGSLPMPPPSAAPDSSSAGRTSHARTGSGARTDTSGARTDTVEVGPKASGVRTRSPRQPSP
jgi:hypothetical protein